MIVGVSAVICVAQKIIIMIIVLNAKEKQLVLSLHSMKVTYAMIALMMRAINTYKC